MMKRVVLGLVVLVFSAMSAWAGSGYEITAQKGGKEVNYRVDFGGGMMFDMYTGFDPATKKFVYLTWNRQEKPPKPAMTFWDHRTGELVQLYKFPNVKNPLPVIPSIEEMKVCPITGDKNFKAKRDVIVD